MIPNSIFVVAFHQTSLNLIFVDAEPQDFPKTAANIPIPIPKSQPTPASQSDSVPVTQAFHLLTDQILPTPVKKMSPRHLQDGEVYQGEAYNYSFAWCRLITILISV